MRLGFLASSIAALSAGSSVAFAAPMESPAASNRATADHVVVELVSESTSVKPGASTWVGIKFIHEPHWHTYWMNSGDSGLPTRLEWQMPKGFKSQEISWPAPKRFALGDLYNFGYDDTVLLPVRLDVGPDAVSDSSTGMVTIAVTAKWLICNDVCIPGKALLSIALPMTTKDSTADTRNAPLFAAARATLPKTARWSGRAGVSGDRVRIELRGADLPAAASLDVFPIAAKLLDNTPPKITRSGDRLIIEAQKSDYFDAAPDKLSLVVTQRNAGKNPPQVWRADVPWVTVP